MKRLPSLVCAVSVAACFGTTGEPASRVAAINSANAAGGANVVQLGAACTCTLTVADNNWYGPNGLPAIASDITIDGNEATVAPQRGAGDSAFQAVLRRRGVRQPQYGHLRFAWLR